MLASGCFQLHDHTHIVQQVLHIVACSKSHGCPGVLLCCVQVMSVVGILQDETDPMVSVMKVRHMQHSAHGVRAAQWTGSRDSRAHGQLQPRSYAAGAGAKKGNGTTANISSRTGVMQGSLETPALQMAGVTALVHRLVEAGCTSARVAAAAVGSSTAARHDNSQHRCVGPPLLQIACCTTVRFSVLVGPPHPNIGFNCVCMRPAG